VERKGQRVCREMGFYDTQGHASHEEPHQNEPEQKRQPTHAVIVPENYRRCQVRLDLLNSFTCSGTESILFPCTARPLEYMIIGHKIPSVLNKEESRCCSLASFTNLTERVKKNCILSLQRLDLVQT
jgi:hypothetical protein